MNNRRVSFHQLILPTFLPLPIFPSLFFQLRKLPRRERERGDARISFVVSPSSLPPLAERWIKISIEETRPHSRLLIAKRVVTRRLSAFLSPSFVTRGDVPRGRKFVKFRTKGIRAKVFKSICELLPRDVERNLRGETRVLDLEGKKKKERNSAVTTRVTWKRRFARNEREKRTGEINIHCSLKNSFQFFSPPSLSLSVREFLICLSFSSSFFPSLKMQNVRGYVRGTNDPRVMKFTPLLSSLLPFFLSFSRGWRKKKSSQETLI